MMIYSKANDSNILDQLVDKPCGAIVPAGIGELPDYDLIQLFHLLRQNPAEYRSTQNVCFLPVTANAALTESLTAENSASLRI